jgi:FKBP-type peptidyl-prolyl cis-trans isomerase
MGSKETREEDKEKAAEAKKAKEAEAQAKKKAEEAEEKAKKKAKAEDKKTSAELHKGLVTLSIMPPADSGQVKRLEESLHESPDLRLVIVSGSVANGTEMVISTENAIPLVDILMKMPPVAQVAKKGKTLQITLKSE